MEITALLKEASMLKKKKTKSFGGKIYCAIERSFHGEKKKLSLLAGKKAAILNGV